MGHYITEIKINKLLHLSNIVIPLSCENRQHLMITGKNGAGKTSLLRAMRTSLKAINDGKWNVVLNKYSQWLELSESKVAAARTEKEKFEAQEEYERNLGLVKKYKDGVDILFNDCRDLDALYAQGKFITA